MRFLRSLAFYFQDLGHLCTNLRRLHSVVVKPRGFRRVPATFVESEVPRLTRQCLKALLTYWPEKECGGLLSESVIRNDVADHVGPQKTRGPEGGGSLLHCDGQAGVGENFWGREQILPNSLKDFDEDLHWVHWHLNPFVDLDSHSQRVAASQLQ